MGGFGGLSRDTFYRYKAAVESGGIENLFDKSRRQLNLKNRVDDVTEQAVLAYALDFPAHGQLRVSNELRKAGIFVSSSGVRSIWLRHGLASFKDRLKALEAKVAEQGLILIEAQVAALEIPIGHKRKNRTMKSAGKSKRRTLAIWGRKTPSMSALSKVWAGFISKPLSIPIPRWRLPSSTRPRRRLPQPIYSTTKC